MFTFSKQGRFFKPLSYILIAYLLLGISYSAIVPIFEPPDEHWHYSYVRYLAIHRRFPPRDPDSPLGQQSSQPPLYYAVASLVVHYIDKGEDLTPFLRPNPFWCQTATGGRYDNQNRLLQTSAEDFPWQGVVLAVHLVRLVSLCFGCMAVIGTWGVAHTLFPHRQPFKVLATALVAFTPQFIFVTSAVSNDAAVTAFSTFGLWGLAHGVRYGFTQRRAAATGLMIGLACLSKNSALALLPLAVVGIGLDFWLSANRQARIKTILPIALLLLGISLGVSGWWYIRSAIRYQDFLSISGHLEASWAHEVLTPLPEIWRRLPEVERTYWAAFGWGNVQLPDLFYIMCRAFIYLALFGLTRGLIRRVRREKWGILHCRDCLACFLVALWFAMIFVALLWWMQRVEAALGRLLFPAISSSAILLTLGLSYLPLKRYRSWPGIAFARWLFVVAVLVPGFVIRYAYTPSRYRSPASVPVSQRADVRFSAETDIARLVGYTVAPTTLHGGDRVVITLCWEVLAQPENNYAVSLQLIGYEHHAIAKIDTYPGLGKYPVSRWKIGEVFCDRYRITTGAPIEMPAVYNLQIGLYDFVTGQRSSAAVAADIETDALVLTQLKIVPYPRPELWPKQPFERRFGDQITLLGYNMETLHLSPGDQVHYTLVWQALTRPSVDYTVFAHLYPALSDGIPDFASEIAAQQDAQPTNGRYSTRFWDVGEIIEDDRVLTLPETIAPGRYVLIIGLYRFDTMERLLLPDGASSVSLPTILTIQ